MIKQVELTVLQYSGGASSIILTAEAGMRLYIEVDAARVRVYQGKPVGSSASTDQRLLMSLPAHSTIVEYS